MKKPIAQVANLQREWWNKKNKNIYIYIYWVPEHRHSEIVSGTKLLGISIVARASHNDIDIGIDIYIGIDINIDIDIDIYIDIDIDSCKGGGTDREW